MMNDEARDLGLRRQAVDHLRAGDLGRARSCFDAYLAGAATDYDAEVMLSGVCFRLGDIAAAHAALDRVLAADRSHLRGLLAKADLLASEDRLREANLYYQGLLRHTASGQGAPPDVIQGTYRARAMAERLRRDMGAAVSRDLAAAGYDAAASDPRFTHALDLLTRKRQIYTPQPRAFYYPELPSRQFYPRADFPWLDAVEAEVEAMSAELLSIVSADDGFSPYIRSVPGMPVDPTMALLNDNMNWSAAHLIRDGEETELAARCPRTMAALANAPLCRIRGRSPQVMFSQLKGGAHIVPHHGFVNTRLICHVPLVVPDGCWFRVGNETRAWERGKAFVFDDTIEHEARNESDQTRVVLIFDIWRPELSEEERTLVATLLETLDAFTPEKTDWQ